MREIDVKEITSAVKKMCIDANYYLGDDVLSAIKKYEKTEESPLGKEILNQIITNAGIAKDKQMPLCQDTGYTAVFAEVGQEQDTGYTAVFAEVGQEVHFNGDFNEAINEGVRQGYADGYLRKSGISTVISTRQLTRVSVRVMPTVI